MGHSNREIAVHQRHRGMMDNINSASHQLMRFNILSTALKKLNDSPFSSAYIYAWASGVYPAYDEAAEWHKPFKDCFKISDEQVQEVAKYLEDSWTEKRELTFYQLEDQFDIGSGNEWDRPTLLMIVRYLALHEMFDHRFWSRLLQNEQCPSEALHLNRPLKESDIYFM